MTASGASRMLLVTQRPGRRAALPLAGGAAVPRLHLVEERDPARALDRFARERFDAVALELSREEALHLTADLRRAHPTAIIIVLVPEGDGAFKQGALRSGASAVIAGGGFSEARRNLLETTLQTLRLVALNSRLAAQLCATADSLVRTLRDSQRLCAQRQRARDQSGAALPSESRQRLQRPRGGTDSFRD